MQRLERWYPNTIQVHIPVRASWLKQIEIYFSVVRRKVLSPNDFHDLYAVEAASSNFSRRTSSMPNPFNGNSHAKISNAFCPNFQSTATAHNSNELLP